MGFRVNGKKDVSSGGGGFTAYEIFERRATQEGDFYEKAYYA